jgi:hypothetical protein
MNKRLGAVVLCSLFLLPSASARSQAAREATIQPDTKARIVLQSRLSSKLNEVGDLIAAILYEPVYVDGQLVLPRGTEFHGRITEVGKAGRPQKSAHMAIIFDKVSMPWGEEPVAVTLTAIDDWNKDEKLKADNEGKVKGGRDGGKTTDNVIRGGQIGTMGAGTVILANPSSGTYAAGAAAIGGGMLAGLLLTKGKEVRVEPGAVFRIKFDKPITLPVVAQPGLAPRPIQQEETVKPPSDPAVKKPDGE